MRHATLLHLVLLICVNANAQRILHFTKTSGFDHQTRGVSYTLFQSIATELGATVDDDATAASFTDLDGLLEYDVIVFSNTSGADLFNLQQRSNFEAFVAQGGRVLGIHAASDTYRHSTANGNNTGVWDFYPELIGASVQENPNHVDGTPQYSMDHIGLHASTANLPDPWVKNEEYYYWEGGYYRPDNMEVLRVEETVGPNGQVNSYDAARPMSWYRELPTGNRIFYTALGHSTENYTTNMLFRTHLSDALAWLLDGTTAVQDHTANGLMVLTNPADGSVTIHSDIGYSNSLLILMDATGRIVHRERIVAFPMVVNMHPFPPGLYTLAFEGLLNRHFAIMH